MKEIAGGKTKKKKITWLSKDVARTQPSLKVHRDPGGEIDHACFLALQRLISGARKKVKLDWKNATVYHSSWHEARSIHHSALGCIQSPSRHSGPRHVLVKRDGVSHLKARCGGRTGVKGVTHSV